MGDCRSWGRAVVLGLVGLFLAASCANEQHPKMQSGNGAISGKLIGENKDPFDLGLAGDQPKALAVILSSPAQGTVAKSYPHGGKPEFAFDNVAPGEYELSVYALVPGKRSIAGSQPVTVNADQATPVTMTLHVTPADSSH